MRIRFLATVLVGIAGVFVGILLAVVVQSTHRSNGGGGMAPGKPSTIAAASAPSKAPVKRKILYWWDPMVGVSSISPKPGVSSMGMALIPVYAPTKKSRRPAGEVHVDPVMTQDMGINTSTVKTGPLIHPVRAVGYLRVPTPDRYSVTLRVGGWIGKLYATTNGTAVKKGQRLFTLYSRQIVAAEYQLIAAKKDMNSVAESSGRPAVIKDSRELVRAAALRLTYLGVSGGQIKQVESSLQPLKYVTFYSPASGYLRDIKVRQRSRINAGITAMRVDSLTALWLDSEVFESQLPWIHMGQRVTAKFAAFPGRTFNGKVIFVDAFENRQNHTTAVRIELPNADGKLRPGMYSLADIQTRPIGRAILIPRRAVINTGTGEIVFVESSKGRFDPVAVRTGFTGGTGLRRVVQVISGVRPGQKVVTSGQFMIDVESQLNQIKNRYLAAKTTATNTIHAGKK